MLAIDQIVAQLYPGLPVDQCRAWVRWMLQQPNYRVFIVREAGCVVKLYTQDDPPWLPVGIEVAWWGRGRDAVRALHRGMEWARVKGAKLFAYSLQGNPYVTKWRRL